MTAYRNSSAGTILFFLIGMVFAAGVAKADVLASEEDSPSDESVIMIGESAVENSSVEEELPADQTDHKAQIVSLEGTVYSMKTGESSWSQVQPAAEINEGDKVRTDAGSTAEIAYDSTMLNLTHLKENTVAEFRSIEPTDVFLEDGALFNALDGLDFTSSYQVSTPTYVAGVRGTHFDVLFDKATQQFSAATLSPEEGEGSSRIYVKDPSLGDQAEEIEITEGKQIDVPRGRPLHRDFIQQAAPERIQAAHQSFAQFRNRMPHFEEQRKIGREKFEKRREFLSQQAPDRVNPKGDGTRNELSVKKPFIEHTMGGRAGQGRQEPGKGTEASDAQPKDLDPKGRHERMQDHSEGMQGPQDFKNQMAREVSPQGHVRERIKERWNHSGPGQHEGEKSGIQKNDGSRQAGQMAQDHPQAKGKRPPAGGVSGKPAPGPRKDR